MTVIIISQIRIITINAIIHIYTHSITITIIITNSAITTDIAIIRGWCLVTAIIASAIAYISTIVIDDNIAAVNDVTTDIAIVTVIIAIVGYLWLVHIADHE